MDNYSDNRSFITAGGANKKKERMLEEYKFSIFEDYMISLFARTRQIKVRILVLRATNLAA